MNRNIVFLLNLLLSGLSVHAQENSGTIQYEMTVNMGDLRLDNVPPDIAAMIPKERKSKHILYFSPASSLYETVKEEEKITDYNSSSNNNDIQIKISSGGSEGEEATYVDLDNKKVIEQKELMGKKFLISSPLEKLKWKMTGRQKMLLNYSVQEAMVVNEKDTVIAWFASQIPVATGPMGIGNLPGIVLEAAIGNRIFIQASAVHPGAAVTGKIQQPTKGKAVTKEQFVKIMEEKQKEMGEETGGSGMRRTIIRTIGN